jgi:hypothetical protein
MSDTDTLIRHFIVDGRRRLDTFERSLFHEKLRSPARDNYTKLFEETPEEALAHCEKYLRKAKKCNAPASAISSIQSSTGCWELGTAKSPRRIKLLGVSDYLYRFISLTLTATLPYDGEVVRHLCNNRMCIRPDHLKIGSVGENKMDDILNAYAGGINKDA